MAGPKGFAGKLTDVFIPDQTPHEVTLTFENDKGERVLAVVRLERSTAVLKPLASPAAPQEQK